MSVRKGPLMALETNASGSACSVAPVLSGAVRSPSMAGLKGSSAQCSWVVAPSRGSCVKCHVLSTATKSRLARRHVLLALLRCAPMEPGRGLYIKYFKSVLVKTKTMQLSRAQAMLPTVCVFLCWDRLHEMGKFLTLAKT